ncbi:MAG: penicillin-binding protein [Gammaproteobacteria bacterium HGW-Gammaproteobacteria-12]|nr:MAG: penicillin-binding protein [Gammaproteobacteria bacterium HGW-Gammaproteobacteria-12]
MRTLLLCLLLITHAASAQVYTYIDAEGNRVFTDKPRSSSAERVMLAPSNSMERSQPKPTERLAPAPAASKPTVHYQVLRILVPEPDASIHNGSGNMIVTLNSEPGLLPGHSYRLLLDGEPQGEISRSPVFSLQHIDRGTHQLVAEIIDSAGLIVERTPAQPFHMHRMTLAQKRKINPCKKDEYGVRPECPLKDKPKEEASILPFF